MMDVDALLRDLKDRSRISDLIGPSSWSTVQREFPGVAFERWIDVVGALIAEGIGSRGSVEFCTGEPIGGTTDGN